MRHSSRASVIYLTNDVAGEFQPKRQRRKHTIRSCAWWQFIERRHSIPLAAHKAVQPHNERIFALYSPHVSDPRASNRVQQATWLPAARQLVSRVFSELGSRTFPWCSRNRTKGPAGRRVSTRRNKSWVSCDTTTAVKFTRFHRSETWL